jgi:hypothetical protein
MINATLLCTMVDLKGLHSKFSHSKFNVGAMYSEEYLLIRRKKFFINVFFANKNLQYT